MSSTNDAFEYIAKNKDALQRDLRTRFNLRYPHEKTKLKQKPLDELFKILEEHPPRGSGWGVYFTGYFPFPLQDALCINTRSVSFPNYTQEFTVAIRIHQEGENLRDLQIIKPGDTLKWPIDVTGKTYADALLKAIEKFRTRHHPDK